MAVTSDLRTRTAEGALVRRQDVRDQDDGDGGVRRSSERGPHGQPA
jgi:hypothetical protein